MALPKVKLPKMGMKKYLAGLGFSTAVIISATQLTAPSEGFVESPYLDVTGVNTVCYGTTNNNNVGVVIKEKVYTEQECTLMLAQELQEVEKKIAPLIKVEINDYQKAAFLDFSYNLGVGAFQKSTMLGKLNAGNTEGACDELVRYVFAGDCKEGTKGCVKTSSGKWKLKLNGLVERRELEKKYCLYGSSFKDK